MPDNADALEMLGAVLKAAGDRRGAEQALVKALNSSPSASERATSSRRC